MKGCNGKTTISGWFSLSHWVIDIWHVPLYLDQLAGSFHRTRSSFKAPDLWVKRPRAMRRSHHWSINWSMNEPIQSNPIRSDPIQSDPSFNQSVQSIGQLINPIIQSTNQPINWSMNQCTMNQRIFNIHMHMVYTYRIWGRILPPTHARLKNDLVPKLGPIYLMTAKH